MCVSCYLSVLLKIFILLLKSLQWLPSICKCNSLIAVRTLQKLLVEPTHTSAFHIAFWSLSCWQLFPLEHWYCCKPIKTSVTFAHVPLYTSWLLLIPKLWLCEFPYIVFMLLLKKKDWSWWFSISLQISFHSLEKTSSSKSWWNQDSYSPLRRKVRGQGLPCVYRRAPQKILSYNSEDYTSSDFFFFFSPIGLGKSFLKFSCNIVLKNLNELLGQPNIFMVIKGATSASPAYLIMPWAGGSPERGWAYRFPKPAVQRIHHSHRAAAFCPHCSSVTGGHSSSPEEPCSGCPQNRHGLFFKVEIPRKEYNVLLKSAISLTVIFSLGRLGFSSQWNHQLCLSLWPPLLCPFS